MSLSPTTEKVSTYEEQLDSFDATARRAALEALADLVRRGDVVLPHPGTDVNVHCHSCYSYNAYGYSPSKLAWLGRRAGWAVAGLVDFDALDGLEEFLAAGQLLGLKTCGGMETRVYIPEFAEYVMNSPGEPGISYHMGVGFPRPVEAQAGAFLRRLRGISEQRNRALVARVNAYLDPVALDYDRDVLPLTPAGNATERHICVAYARRAHALFPEGDLPGFWSCRLGVQAEALDLPEGPKLQGLIRARTMKQGGVGYVEPDRGSFPKLEETNAFILQAGGIPTHTWLDGTSEGEQRIAEVLEVAMRSGVAALNIVPDRNYGPVGGQERLANLYSVVEVAKALDLLLVVGTEMNSPGQKLVDDFASPELSPLVPTFLESARAIYAHSVLQRGSGLGYMSEWAKGHFPTLAARKGWYGALGRALSPSQEVRLAELPAGATPGSILEMVG